MADKRGTVAAAWLPCSDQPKQEPKKLSSSLHKFLSRVLPTKVISFQSSGQREMVE